MTHNKHSWSCNDSENDDNHQDHYFQLAFSHSYLILTKSMNKSLMFTVQTGTLPSFISPIYTLFSHLPLTTVCFLIAWCYVLHVVDWYHQCKWCLKTAFDNVIFISFFNVDSITLLKMQNIFVNHSQKKERHAW